MVKSLLTSHIGYHSEHIYTLRLFLKAQIQVGADWFVLSWNSRVCRITPSADTEYHSQSKYVLKRLTNSNTPWLHCSVLELKDLAQLPALSWSQLYCTNIILNQTITLNKLMDLRVLTSIPKFYLCLTFSWTYL